MTESEPLCHSHAVVPLRTRSVSPMSTGTARRSFCGPPYQIFSVCDPASSDVIESGFALPGSCGMPSAAVSTTVPVSGGRAVWSPATAASSCAGVRGGSAGAACATVMAEAMPTAATAATMPAGTTQRARRENFGIAAMKPLLACCPGSREADCRPGPVIHCARRRCGIPVSKGHAATSGQRGAGSMRVLVVEDERRLAAAVRRGLQAEGFAVDLAHDGEDGLHLAREGAYDALVLDLMLPKISGYRICRQLRAEENWVPILILSAKDGEYDLADGLDLGADDYLTKPFSYVVLAARLRALLRRGAQPRPAQLRAGDLTLDPGTRQVRRGETAIELTPREFALLEYLMRKAGQVVSKSSLLEHVWDAYDTLDPNVVEVYAGYLRRKIDNPFGRRALQTVRGAGYRLAADGG